MAKRTSSGKQGIRYLADFDGVAAVIGAIDAAEKMGRKDRYIGKLITAAHATVADEFDMQIAADATTTTTLNHMFEWGTIGINPGGTRRINPISQEARLWTHLLIGSGRSKGVAYNFLPSKVPVPRPTTSKTGIAQKYLSKLNMRHVFWNKAFVMESGTSVTITPKKAGGKLFIPIKGLSGTSDPEALKRGFVMSTGPVTATPGGNNIGTFNAYWEKFWNGMGEDGMRAHMEKSFQADLSDVLARANKVRGDMKPPGMTNFEAEVQSRSKKSESTMMQNADRRARKRSHD